MAVKSEMTDNEMKNLKIKLMIRFLFFLVFSGLCILLPAGTFYYWQAYVYIVALAIPMMFVLFYFLKNDPQFLLRRTRTKEKEKPQVIIQVVFTLFFFFAYILSGLDKRFGWSDVPVLVVLCADLVMLLGYIIVIFVFKQNSYASRVVEVENSQKVITTGLYRIVRHPMYFGVLVMWLPTPVALGSYWGLIPMATIPLALILRIFNEEKVLVRDLPGYEEYCQKTRYRLIPGIW